MDESEFKNLMASVPAPVTVVTSVDRGAPVGATVSSFASLSLEPKLVSIGLIEGSRILATLRTNRRFAINLLSHSQADLALQFASREPDRFAQVNWVWHNGLPRLNGIASYLECCIESDIQAGDHAMIFCRVLACQTHETPPLVYTARKFGTHSKLIADRTRSVSDAIEACSR